MTSLYAAMSFVARTASALCGAAYTISAFAVPAVRAWFAKELRHEPNPRRLFQDAFNDVPVEAIPRDAALRMIQFFLSARELHEFPEGKYPADVTRTSEKLLKDFERGHGLRFRSEFVVNLGPDQGGERTVRTPITPETVSLFFLFPCTGN